MLNEAGEHSTSIGKPIVNWTLLDEAGSSSGQPRKRCEEQKPIGEALASQIGGAHYKALAIQPVEYCQRNGLGFIEGCVVKYVTRWKSKGGIDDIKKARHMLDMLIEMEELP